MVKPSLLLLVGVGLSCVASAGAAGTEVDVEIVRRLALERIRSAPHDFERVLVTAENRLHRAEGVPSTADARVAALRSDCVKMQRLALSGRAPGPDPAALRDVEKRWDSYREEVRDLKESLAHADKGVSESQLYWDTVARFEQLKLAVNEDILFNTPPGEQNLASAFHRDEEAILIACERSPRATRAPHPKVLLPAERSGTSKLDLQAFYRSQDMVPEKNPAKAGAFIVPRGCRTVTRRESGVRWVFRAKGGRGVAFIGQQEVPLHYGYRSIAPDTPFYFENIGPEPLEIEYVGMLSQ